MSILENCLLLVAQRKPLGNLFGECFLFFNRGALVSPNLHMFPLIYFLPKFCSLCFRQPGSSMAFAYDSKLNLQGGQALENCMTTYKI